MDKIEISNSDWSLVDELLSNPNFKKALDDVEQNQEEQPHSEDGTHSPSLKKKSFFFLKYRRKSEFLCKTEFRPFLPEAKLYPKMLSFPVKRDFLAEFSAATLEFSESPDCFAHVLAGFPGQMAGDVSVASGDDMGDSSGQSFDDSEKEILFDGERNLAASSNAGKANVEAEAAAGERGLAADRQPQTIASSSTVASEDSAGLNIFKEGGGEMGEKKTGEEDGEALRRSLKHPLNDSSAYIKSIKPIFPHEALLTKKLTRITFDNDIQLEFNTGKVGPILIENEWPDSMYYSLYKSESAKAEMGDVRKSAGEFEKANIGARPPPSRRSILIEGDSCAWFAALDCDLKLREKNTPKKTAVELEVVSDDEGN